MDNKGLGNRTQTRNEVCITKHEYTKLYYAYAEVSSIFGLCEVTNCPQPICYAASDISTSYNTVRVFTSTAAICYSCARTCCPICRRLMKTVVNDVRGSADSLVYICGDCIIANRVSAGEDVNYDGSRDPRGEYNPQESRDNIESKRQSPA